MRMGILVLMILSILTIFYPNDAAALTKLQEIRERSRPKSFLEETIDLLTGAYQWPKGKNYLLEHQYIGSFSVFPRENMKVPTNMSIQVIGPYKPNEIKMELWDATNDSRPKFSKDITLFYYYNYEMIILENGENIPRIQVPKEKIRYLYPYNPNLENSRTYEIRLYQLENFQAKQLLLKYRFYTLDDNSQFVP